MGENYLIVRAKPKRSFIAKHKRWFSVASTAVVLGTFIVNEALRNQAKDLADSISNARTNFTIRSDIRTMVNKLENLDDRLTNTNNMLENLVGHPASDDFHPTPIQSEYISEIDSADDEMNEHILWLLNFDNTMALYARLPYDRSLDDQHWAIILFNDAYEHYFADSKTLANAFHSADMNKTAKEYAIVRGDRDQIEVRRAKMLAIFKVPGPGAGVDPLDLFSSSVVQHAQKVQEKAEAKAKLWRDLSFLLYPFGLAIAFVGKLDDDESPIEESS